MWLDSGETPVVTESSNFFDTWLWLLVEEADGSYTIIASNDDFGGTFNSRLDFTATASGFYHIAPTSLAALATGGYTLTISSSGGSQAPLGLEPATTLPGALVPLPAPGRSRTLIVRSAPGLELVRKR